MSLELQPDIQKNEKRKREKEKKRKRGIERITGLV
jgi:hypothetical protein